MRAWDRLKKRLRKKSRASPLKREIADLVSKIEREENRLGKLSQDFFINGGICCPSCGIPGFDNDLYSQRLRERRLKQLRSKLQESTSKVKYTNESARPVIKAWLDAPNGLQPLFVDHMYKFFYLTKKFDVRIDDFRSYLDGNMGLKRSLRERIAGWCEQNIHSVFDDKGVIHYREY